MIIKDVRLLISAAAMLLSVQASAMSLGEIVVHSKLSQPLDAEIAVPSIRADEESSLAINIAPENVFEQAGVERSAVLNRFIFSLKYKDGKTPYIQIRTREPISELAISFFLEVTWKTGRIVRQYDILLEPPGMQSAVKYLKDGQKVALGPQPAPQEEQKNDNTINQVDSMSVLATHVMQNPNAIVSYGPVRPGESLGKIAQKVRPDPRMSLPQVMLALFENNKDAFLGNNINNLKAGSMLYLMSQEQITSLGRGKAMHIVAQHEQRWKTGETELASRSDQVADQLASKVNESANGGVIQRGPNAVAENDIEQNMPKLPAKLPDMPLNGNEKEYIATLTQELRTALDAAEKLQQKNELLRSRLQDIESKVAMVQDKLNIAGEVKPPADTPQAAPQMVAKLEPPPQAPAKATEPMPPAKEDPNKPKPRSEVAGQFLLVLSPDSEKDAHVNQNVMPNPTPAVASDDASVAPVFIAAAADDVETPIIMGPKNMPKSASILAGPPKTIARKEPQFIDQNADNGDQSMLTAIGGFSIVSLALLGFAMRHRRDIVSDGFKRLRAQLKGRKQKIEWIK